MGEIIAFIPARGGSKSIPLKNIKLFCGKPLIYWTIKALFSTALVDNIIVATDSDLIESTVASFGFDRIFIYRRSSQSASDTASTESVMIEYIEKYAIDDETVFMLVQATSPLTQTEYFNQGLELFLKKNYDSVLSCVRNYRFFWNNNGNPINYDYRNRPRRQEFSGVYMENGAFYINRVKNIIKTKNRIGGNIGIYEMPDYTSYEIDEPDDWILMEQLMYRHVLLKLKRDITSVKLFLSDVDGVLTDSGMYYSNSDDELKKFNTRDGMAFELLRKQGILTGVVTSETTKIVHNRASKLKLDFVIQGKGFSGKLDAVKSICMDKHIDLEEVAYVGDDINCKDLLENVGFAFCPGDAVKIIKNIPSINVVDSIGGSGVVREIVDNFFQDNAE